MKYELSLFDNTYFFGLNNQIDDNTISNIMAEIKKTVFTLKSTEQVKLYIQHHQKALINFKEDPRLTSVCDQILYFIETFFPGHVNTLEPVSVIAKEKLFEQHHTGLVQVYNILKENCSPVFLETLQPIFQFEELLVSQYRYLKNVLPEILHNQATINEDQLIEILIQSNFNTPKFANYLNNTILSELNTEDYLEDQLMILLEKEKEYNQIIISINDGYEPELQTITRQVITWIELEIKYCKKKLKNRIANQGQIEFKPRTLFQTSMSVNQLACLFKAFKDVEAITNPIQKDLFKAVAKDKPSRSKE